MLISNPEQSENWTQSENWARMCLMVVSDFELICIQKVRDGDGTIYFVGVDFVLSNSFLNGGGTLSHAIYLNSQWNLW